MKNKYFNDALIGNNKIKASFSKKGELLRLFYGSADYKQFLNFWYSGVKVNDSNIIYLHDDVNNIYSQKYLENTNILETNIFNTYFKLRIIQTDFVPINEKILVKKYKLVNENNIDLNINFLTYSKLLTNLNNDTSGFFKDNMLIQYTHDFSVCTFSNKDVLSYQINNVPNNIHTGKIGGKDYIGMSPDSGLSYDINCLKPGEEREIIIYIYINKNKHINILNQINDEIDRIKNINVNFMLENTKEYWKNYVINHDILKINLKNYPEKVKKVYNRTILLFPLLINDMAGGISAGIEVDENKTKCGRYSYCWPRDAIYISEAFDIVGMEKESNRFYSEFCKITQNKNGNWEQRFYTDGRLAPSWGYQVDETASVVYGVYNQYKYSNDIEFLKNNFKMCEKAVEFLKIYVSDIFSEKPKMKKSYDLWEEVEEISLYSLSAIYGAFNKMINIYKEFQNTNNKKETEDKVIELENLKNVLKDYCQNTFYNCEKQSFVRNNNDKKIDISLIGSVVPFQMFDKKDEKVINTIEKINLKLRTYTNGYLRYEDDCYMGGKNPWPIATLWMAWYYIEINEIEKAKELFEFVTNSASEHGLLGEQVNNEKMKPAWVIGLTWSHAMYIIILNKLIELSGKE